MKQLIPQKSNHRIDQPLVIENSTRVQQLQNTIFKMLNVNYIKKTIKINQNQSIYSIYVESKNKGSQNETYYLGHGFASTSLFYFPYFKKFLETGNLVIWQIRGMGLSSNKPSSFQEITSIQAIQKYFLDGITQLLQFYRHERVVMICHSFSAYLALMHYIKIKSPYVSKLVLLSPVGITPRQQDQKNSIHSCSDFFHTILSKFGWQFKLSYKSVLRGLCCCFKNRIVEKQLTQLELSQEEKNLYKQLVIAMVGQPDGSQELFFSYFEPRVIPKIPIRPIFMNIDKKIEIVMFFGGQSDWADRKSAYQLANEYPQNIKIHEMGNCGHNIPFDIKIMNQIITMVSRKSYN